MRRVSASQWMQGHYRDVPFGIGIAPYYNLVSCFGCIGRGGGPAGIVYDDDTFNVGTVRGCHEVIGVSGQGCDVEYCSSPPTVLVVDDDQAMRSLLHDELRDEGYRVIESGDAACAFQQLRDSCPDVVVTDLKMPGGGIDYIRQLCAVAQVPPVIVITAFGDSTTYDTLRECGVVAYFDKPVRASALKEVLKHVCAKKETASRCGHEAARDS